ncbi:MAG TPA: dUTP diphosphatase [Candidatus Campbellbacteria bacterium]|nr:dUTP diphosphatase [Candidatus Campbellbacteria bacterium]
MKIKVKKISEEAVAPSSHHKGDAGLDLYSAEEIILKPGERVKVGTGIAMEIPDGYAGLIWDKSGVVANYGIKTMAGVVDSCYRGEISVVLINLSDKDFKIEKKQKIAQMLIQKIENPEIEIVESLRDSERDESGFGSTGVF